MLGLRESESDWDNDVESERVGVGGGVCVALCERLPDSLKETLRGSRSVVVIGNERESVSPLRDSDRVSVSNGIAEVVRVPPVLVSVSDMDS